MIENNNDSQIILIQNKALELSLFLSIPATIALFIASKQIISALFGYGSFSEISVENSSLALLRALLIPLITVSKEIPLSTCAWGSKKISV